MNLLDYVQRKDVAKFEIVDGVFKPYTTYNEDLEAGIKRSGEFYFQVNKGRKNGKLKNEDVTQIKFLFIDFDMKLSPYAKDVDNLTEGSQKLYMEYVENELQKAGLWPDALVWSGRGVHAYFPIDDDDGAKIAELADIQRNIVKMFKYAGADQSVKDISRILRLPGTLNGKYETLNTVFHKKRCGGVYHLQDFNHVYHNDISVIITERTIQARRFMVKPIDENMKLEGHDYFYFLITHEGNRHHALIKYGQYLRQNYFNKEECKTILDKLAITVQNLKDHEVTETEVNGIVDWVFSVAKNIHTYVWAPNLHKKFTEIKEAAKKAVNDLYFSKCVERIFGFIQKYGPSFYLKDKEFEGKKEGDFSGSTNRKVIELLVDAKILTEVQNGGRYDGHNYATHYVITDLKPAVSLVLESIKNFFNKIVNLISFAFSNAKKAAAYAERFMLIGQAQITGDWSRVPEELLNLPDQSYTRKAVLQTC